MDFPLPNRLEGQLLKLRPLKAEDFNALYQVASDPLIWAQHPVRNRYERPVFEQFFDEALTSGGALVAIGKDHNAIIGSSRFHAYDPKAREVEIGWTFLARAYWGGACNKEMKQLMLIHAFKYVDTVVLVVDSNNHRSQRAAQKIGGAYRETRYPDDGREDFVYQLDRRCINPNSCNIRVKEG